MCFTNNRSAHRSGCYEKLSRWPQVQAQVQIEPTDLCAGRERDLHSSLYTLVHFSKSKGPVAFLCSSDSSTIMSSLRSQIYTSLLHVFPPLSSFSSSLDNYQRDVFAIKASRLGSIASSMGTCHMLSFKTH